MGNATCCFSPDPDKIPEYHPTFESLIRENYPIEGTPEKRLKESPISLLSAATMNTEDSTGKNV